MKLVRLKSLLDSGLISQEDFDEAKAEVLKQLIGWSIEGCLKNIIQKKHRAVSVEKISDGSSNDLIKPIRLQKR